MSAPADSSGELPLDPIVHARGIETQRLIRAALDEASRVLAGIGLPLHLVSGSAILADLDLGDGMRRRAVSAALLVPEEDCARAVRAFRAAGYDLGQPIDDSEILRASGRRRVVYALIENKTESPVRSLRHPTAHPGSEEGRRQRLEFFRATMNIEFVAVLSRVWRTRNESEDISESIELKIAPYLPGDWADAERVGARRE
jgi:hypothetical protein